jgi:hypothetical protein
MVTNRKEWCRMERKFRFRMVDTLGLLGLRRKRGSFVGIVVPALGLLAVGAAVGAGVGLAFAPASGRRLRRDMTDRLDQMRARVIAEAKKGFVNATHG